MDTFFLIFGISAFLIIGFLAIAMDVFDIVIDADMENNAIYVYYTNTKKERKFVRIGRVF